MKYLLVIVVGLLSITTFAKSGLSEHLIKALHQSEVQKTQSKVSLDIQKDSEQIAWRQRGKQPRVIEIESAVMGEVPKTVLATRKPKKIDTAKAAEKALEAELSQIK